MRDNGPAFAPDQIVVGSGAKNIILSALPSVVDPGDEVVIPTPFWVTYPDLVALAGLRLCRLRRDERLQTDAGRLAARSVAADSGGHLQLPQQPVRRRLRTDEIRQLAAVLRQHPDIWVVTDEIYEHVARRV